METSQEDLLQVVDVEQKAFSLLEVIQMTEAGEESNLHRPENEDGDARLTVQEDAQILQEGIAGAGQQIMRDVTDEQVSYEEQRRSSSAPAVTIVSRRRSITADHSSRMLYLKGIRIHLPKAKRKREQATAQNQSQKRGGGTLPPVMSSNFSPAVHRHHPRRFLRTDDR